MKINFEAKSDRELLVLAAQSCNQTEDHLARLNATILKHEKRLTILEARPGCESTKSRWNWQTITLIASVIALIIVGIGTRVNWW